MSTKQRQAESSKETISSIDALMSESTPRRVSTNTERSLRMSLPRDYANHIGLGEGAAAQFSVHFGSRPVLVEEPCLIITRYPAGEDR